MQPRLALACVRDRLRRQPAVALVGPRQAGKTTLAHALRAVYFDLEQPPDRVWLRDRPRLQARVGDLGSGSEAHVSTVAS